ncbi:MAG: helix-turn-helix domain-containing protein [Bacillota bacterium]
MLYFFIGIIFSLLVFWLYLNIFASNLSKSIEEASLVKRDLEILYGEYEKLTAELTKDIEMQINNEVEARTLTSGNLDNGIIPLDNSRRINKEIKQRTVNPRKISTKSSHSNNKFGYTVPKLNVQHKEIIELAAKGWTVKQISQHLNIGQDQAAMIIQLYKE